MKKYTLNEEMAKVYLISYFQNKLGIALSDLEAETPFTIRLGRSERKTPILQGRLDLLIRRGGKNLCVVEMKAEGNPLTEDDKKQAMSYALMLDQRAPVVFVTNGIESKLYDVWTGNLLNDTLISLDSLYKISPPADFLARREEALAFFLGLSPENLLAFCREQTASRMRNLRGSAQERDRKYIPELFVPRGIFRESVRSFLTSPQSLFVLTGDAGIGKTCELCALAEWLLKDGTPALFYRGSMISSEPLLRGIADDFAWTFAEEESPRDLIRRLRVILGNRKLLVIVDAVDEWDYSGRMQNLITTSRRLVGTNVKLLVSCKTLAWPEFAKQRGVPTDIEAHLYGGNPQFLPAMSSIEQWHAIDLYRVFYGVHGGFESRALEAAQESPFILRILFEVASKRKEEHILFSSLQFFDQYYGQLLDRLGDGEGGSQILKVAARLLFEREEERLDVDELYGKVGFESARNIFAELVQFQIFERTGESWDSSLRFYFSLLRDYLVAFHVYRWHKLNEAELGAILNDSCSSGVRVEALAFFYRYSDPAKQRILAGTLVDKARDYLHLYDRVLREHFPRIRSHFSPFTEGEIEFVGELIVSNRTLGYYGFRERSGGDEVALIPLPRFEESNILYLYGVHNPRAVGRFEENDIRGLVFEYEIGRQFKGLFDNGFLDEACAPALAAEMVSCAVSRDRNVFSDVRAASSAGPIFPLEVGRVRRWWRYELLRVYFWDMRMQEKLREKGQGAHGVSSEEFTAEDYVWIRESIEHNLRESDEVVRRWAEPQRRNLMSNLDRHLARAFATLEQAGIDVIESHPVLSLSDPRTMWTSYPQSFKNEICRYVERLLSIAFPIVKRLIEHNFPTLFREFPAIKNGPFLGIVMIDFEGALGPYGTLYLCEADEDMGDSRFVAKPREEIDARIVRNPEFRFEVCYDNIWRLRIDRELTGQRHLRIQSLLRPQHDYLGFRGHFSGSGEIQPVMRAIVYDWIRQEFAHVFSILCGRYGITPDESRWALFAQPKNS